MLNWVRAASYKCIVGNWDKKQVNFVYVHTNYNELDYGISIVWIFLPVIFSDAPIYRQNMRDQFIGNIFTSVISKILANYRQTIIDAILTI